MPCCWDVCAAGQGGRAPSFPHKRVSGAPGAYEQQVRKIEPDPIWTDERQRWTYENGERYFCVSYGVLTELLRIYLILTYFATETATATATATDTERWKPGVNIFGPRVLWCLCRLALDFMHTTDLACKLSYYLRYSSKLVSAWVTVTIVIERLIIVALPLKVGRFRFNIGISSVKLLIFWYLTVTAKVYGQNGDTKTATGMAIFK